MTPAILMSRHQRPAKSNRRLPDLKYCSVFEKRRKEALLAMKRYKRVLGNWFGEADVSCCFEGKAVMLGHEVLEFKIPGQLNRQW
jgi:hypothetical protein